MVHLPMYLLPKLVRRQVGSPRHRLHRLQRAIGIFRDTLEVRWHAGYRLGWKLRYLQGAKTPHGTNNHTIFMIFMIFIIIIFFISIIFIFIFVIVFIFIIIIISSSSSSPSSSSSSSSSSITILIKMQESPAQPPDCWQHRRP